MSGNRATLRVVAATLVVISSLTVPAAVAADSDSGPLDEMFATDGENGAVEYVAFAMGYVERFSPIGGEDGSNVSQHRSNLTTEFNRYNTTYISWVNDRANVTEQWDVIRLHLHDSEGNSAWVFIVSDVNTTSGNITSARMVGLTEFRDENREVDKTYTLDPFATRNADDELERFRKVYAEDNDDVRRVYLANMAGKYKGQVDGPGIPEGDD